MSFGGSPIAMLALVLLSWGKKRVCDLRTACGHRLTAAFTCHRQKIRARRVTLADGANQRMKLTGAAILVSRGMKVLQAAPAAYPYRSPESDAADGDRVHRCHDVLPTVSRVAG